MDQDAYNYVTRMVNQGYLSNEQGYKILAVELGLDLGKFATGNVSQLAGQTAAATTGRSSALATGKTSSNLANNSGSKISGTSAKPSASTSSANLAANLAAAAALEALKKIK